MMKKNKQNEGQQAGRRLRKAVDGPEIMKRYATTPTPEGLADVRRESESVLAHLPNVGKRSESSK